MWLWLYVATDPVPGGCNLELPLQNDPNVYLTTSSAQTHVRFAYGDLAVDGVVQRCGTARQHSMPVYDVYQMYLYEHHLDEDTFFDAVEHMLRAEDISTSARLVRITA